jgi:hypothetical protein
LQIEVAIPFLMSLTARTDVEARSHNQFRVKFTSVGLDTHIHTPQLLAALQLPSHLDILGNKIDLSPLQGLVNQLNTGTKYARV